MASLTQWTCQSFPASGSFQMSQLFSSGGQSIGASALVLPMNPEDVLQRSQSQSQGGRECRIVSKWSPGTACQCWKNRRHRLDPWVGKMPWRRKWQPTPVFLVENPMDRGAWQATVHGVTQSRTRLGTSHPSHPCCVEGGSSLLLGWAGSRGTEIGI